jgi:hypothetical protein
MADAPKPPYDQRLANEAAAADQCMKLGAVLLAPRPRQTGFASEPAPPKPPVLLDD